MATWVVHLRLADYFLNKIKEISPQEFIAGSVAPDCGYGEKDSPGKFDPPPSVTHWTPTGSKKDCRYADFYNEYLNGKEKDKPYWFYLGYYIHLITDIMWSSRVYLATLDKYPKEAEDYGFIKQIKADWNDLDYKYIKEHPKFRALDILSKLGRVRDYLPYYKPNQLTEQIKNISDYYRENIGNQNLYREYTYLTEDEVNNFISCAKELICMDLKRKNLI